MSENTGKRILTALSITPIIGGLFKCKYTDHRNSIKEYFPILILSSIPLWLTALLDFVLVDYSVRAFWDSLIGNSKNGELFIYCTSILAPTFYLAIYDKKELADHPNRLSMMLTLIIIIAICTAFFVLYRSQLKLIAESVFVLSIASLVVSLLLYYLAILYDNFRQPEWPASKMKDDFERESDELGTGLTNRRGSNGN